MDPVSRGVTVWGRDLGADGRNGSENTGHTCGIFAAGDGAEYAMTRG